MVCVQAFLCPFLIGAAQRPLVLIRLDQPLRAPSQTSSNTGRSKNCTGLASSASFAAGRGRWAVLAIPDVITVSPEIGAATSCCYF